MGDQEVTLGEIYRSQLKTEGSVNSLDSKLSGMVTKAEHAEAMGEVRSRLHVGEGRISELSERSTLIESGLAHTDSKINATRGGVWGLSLALATAVIAAIMKFIAI